MEKRDQAKSSGGGGGSTKGSTGILRVDASKSHRISVQVSDYKNTSILYKI